ncbi:MAG: AI-2E family transporter [Chloroflexi bacterium]|nr:AI-2E family transporter [Chloroflexota bacterium]MYF23073.1 AI-2E family transporter [Chloroflexota bacterium]
MPNRETIRGRNRAYDRDRPPSVHRLGEPAFPIYVSAMSSLAPRWLQTISEVALRLIVVAGFLILLGLALDRLRLIFLPLLAALILTSALLPAKHILMRRGIPNAVAAIAVVVAGLAALGAIGYFTVSTLTSEFDELEVDIEAGFTEVLQSIGDWAGISDDEVDQAIDDVLEGVRGNADTIAGSVFSGVRLAAEVLAGIILLAVLTFLLVKDAESIQRGIARRLGRRRRRDFLLLTSGLVDTLGKYFRGVTIVAFMDAVLIGIGLVIIGIPFALPLAVLTFFGAFIPVIGAVLAGLAAFLIALAAEGVTAALIVGGLVLAVQQIEGNVMAPFILGRSISLHPMLVILAVATGGALWGIMGAFVAVPLTAIAVALLDFYTMSGRFASRKSRRAAAEADP